MKNKLKQLLDPTLFRFLLVGVVNTAVGYGIMFGLYNLAGLHTWGDLGYWISSAANYVVGSVVSFFLNKHFTFRNEERGAGVVLRFAVNIAVCWALAYGLTKPKPPSGCCPEPCGAHSSRPAPHSFSQYVERPPGPLPGPGGRSPLRQRLSLPVCLLSQLDLHHALAYRLRSVHRDVGGMGIPREEGPQTCPRPG